MGLDGVELVLGWEEAFGIKISYDDSIGMMLTPRHTVDYLVSRLAGAVDPANGVLWDRANIEGTVRLVIHDRLRVSDFKMDEYYRDLGMTWRHSGFRGMRGAESSLSFYNGVDASPVTSNRKSSS
jgi:hypothetical protein